MLKNDTTSQSQPQIDVGHTASLANLIIPQAMKDNLSDQLDEVLQMVSTIKELETEGIEETHHAVLMTNVWREDEVEVERVLSQDEALRNAINTYDGYFVVPAVLEQ